MKTNKIVYIMFFMICHCYLTGQNLNVQKTKEFLAVDDYKIVYSKKDLPRKIRKSLKVCNVKILF